jgi:transcriptional regulator with AAA-type ATPase domain/tetratricopeptide (TPR) repeat protein
VDTLVSLLGSCPAIVGVREAVAKLIERSLEARRMPPILLRGETGTGKGLLARAIHDSGPRAAHAFVDVNCAAIPGTLLEAEMFGVERGAFTDARETKPGLFRAAHRGTLFLDEIGLVPPGLQAKLLSAIEDQRIRRLGSTRTELVDAWILAATNADLAAATRAGQFREDLYHRLSVITLWLPPLRERGEDILDLAHHFLARACREYDLPSRTFTADARAAMLAYSWPGNVREVANVMERVALLSEARAITAEMLGLPVTAPPEPDEGAPPARDTGDREERDRLLEAMQETEWNVSRAAVRLRISRNMLRYRLTKYGIKPQRGAAAAPEATAREAAPAAPAQALAPEVSLPLAGVRWERRRLTLLYAVLANHPQEGALLEATRSLETYIQKVDSFGGRVEELSPTRALAVFGFDVLEDAPDRAALSAMSVLKVAERGDARPGITLVIHTASFLVAYIGDRVELDAEAKARARHELETLAGLAMPDTALVSPATARFLERRFGLEPVASPGEGRAHAYRLMGREQAGMRRRQSRFVGRRGELELLGSRLDSALRGHGQVVGIGGSAGMGKSRLLLEFRRALAERQVNYLEGQCASYWTATPYQPVMDLLRSGFRLREADPASAVSRKVRYGLRRLGLDPADTAPFIERLLGAGEVPAELASLTAEAMNVRTAEVLRQIALQTSRRRPLVLAIEDVQWIDSASDAFLTSLIESLGGARILVIVTYRPGHVLPWLDRSYVTSLSLQALGADDGRELMLDAAAAAEGVPEAVARTILDKSEGNPFFIEELARAVTEQGEVQAVQVPDTIQEVLLARMARLSEPLRAVLQTAAVLGREVPLRLLSAVSNEPADHLVNRLRELNRPEFIHEAGSAGEPVYVFTHTLTREVAYDSLLPAMRETLHERAGRALETLCADRLDEATDALAYHYSRTSDSGKAVAYLTAAALKAARAYAHPEAVAALEEALAHAERLPAGERDRRAVELTLRIVESLSFLGRFSEALERLLGAGPRVEALGDPGLAAQHLFWLGNTYSTLGELERAVENARHAIAAAERAGDRATLGKAYALLAQQCSLAGQPMEGAAHGRRAVELLQQTDERRWLGFAHWIVGINHITLGEFETALTAQAHAGAEGEATGDSRMQSYAAWTAGWVHALRGEFDRALEGCQRALASSRDPVSTAVITTHLGHVYLDMGDLGRAMPLLEQSAAMLSEFRFRPLQGRALTFLAEGCLATGQLDRARALAGEAIALEGAARYAYGRAWAQWALGRIEAARGRHDEGIRLLQEALDAFRSIGAAFMEGRIHLTLAGLTHEAGSRDAAARHLDEALRIFRTLRVPHYEGEALKLAGTARSG